MIKGFNFEKSLGRFLESYIGLGSFFYCSGRLLGEYWA
jgi:hypothetical protein